MSFEKMIPVLEMDAVSREKKLNILASTMGTLLIDYPDGISPDELFANTYEQTPGYRDDYILALSRLDIVEDDDCTVKLFTNPKT